MLSVVPYIGTWIETGLIRIELLGGTVVPYIGTWIETKKEGEVTSLNIVVPYIGTWIETGLMRIELLGGTSRTLYRYVD